MIVAAAATGIGEAADTTGVQRPIGCVMDDSYERCFTLFTMSRVWEDAQSVCQRQQQQQQQNTSSLMTSSRLVVIDHENVEEMIASTLMEMNAMHDDDDGYGAWTGGRKLDDPDWKWVNGKPFKGNRFLTGVYF